MSLNSLIAARLTAVAMGLALALSACSNASSPEPTQSTPGSQEPSQSASPSATQSPYEELKAAIAASVDAMYEDGVTDTYWDGKNLYYVEVYDPDSKLDYKGAGWIAATEKVEFVFELDMYEVGQLDRAMAAAKPADVTRLEDGRLRLDISLEYFPDFATIELDNHGLVRQVQYPADEKPDRVDVVFAVSDFGTTVLKRANRELLD